MPTSTTAILLIDCPDRKGIVVTIVNFLVNRYDVNILNADQHQNLELGPASSAARPHPIDQPENAAMVNQPHDPYNLQRFVDAQAPVFEQVLAELRAGRKRSHWMWFIFPQIAGLGSSPMAERYAISGRAEAVAYLQHEGLSPRLKQTTELVNQVPGRTIEEIFGYPDNLKFRSSITLFSRVAPEEEVFRAALDKYFAGDPDPATIALL
jgi:uncharacterized protein (DUF1810 family)